MVYLNLKNYEPSVKLLYSHMDTFINPGIDAPSTNNNNIDFALTDFRIYEPFLPNKPATQYLSNSKNRGL